MALMAVVSCVWKTPFTSVMILEPLSPGQPTETFAITPDGATVFGTARASDGTWRAVRWNTTTLAIAELNHFITPDAAAIGASTDGTIIVGGGGTRDQVFSDGYVLPAATWSGGGTAGGALAPFISGSPVISDWQTVGMPFRLCSDNGLAVVGSDGSPLGLATRAAVRWDSGVNTRLVGISGGLSGEAAAQAFCLSADGTKAIGGSGSNSADHTPGGQDHACYWAGATLRLLALPAVAIGASGGFAYLCDSDASVIWGLTPNTVTGHNSMGYWSAVGTVNGDGTHGVFHLMDQLPNTQTASSRLQWVADDPGALVAVGYSPSGASTFHACKWVGAAATDLGAITAGSRSEAWGCNHDGTVVAGWSRDDDATMWPVRWDASNVSHLLPTLAAPDDGFQGRAHGVSRDGATIHGAMSVSDVPPPSLSLAMDDVVCTTEATFSGDTLVSLRWSDDRGHSYGNPVSQSIGDAGAYRTNLQWQRLGMARDRVFELSWSVPTPAALLGCYVDATPAQS
jgi:uncharacterized membrane protein